MSIKRIDIMGINGTPMRVLYIPAGYQSPNIRQKEPFDIDTVEFYDGRYDFTPDGQFISSYYGKTLQEGDQPLNGLDLFGDQPNWKVDAPTMKMVMEWVAYHTSRRL